MNRYKLLFVAIMMTALVGGRTFADTASDLTKASADTTNVLETKMALRDLWVEHVFWIRSYVLASHAEHSAQSEIAEAEVVANAKALAQTVAPFYGQAAADALLELLAGHWGAVQSYNDSTIHLSAPGRDEAVKNLTANAHEIAAFLSGANPHLPEDAVFGLLSTHGAHHVAQINQIDAGQFKLEAATWHEMRKHMLVIADAITEALAKQFPEKF